MESARLATSADIDAIEAVAERRRLEVEPLRGGSLFLKREAGPSPLSERLGRLLADEASGAVVVGCYDDVVFGYSLAVLEVLLDGSKLTRVEHFVVDAEARKSGIGEAMMNLLLEWAEVEGCIGIDSVALPGDRDTKNFFESFGLKARMLTVHRSLEREIEDGAS